MSAFHGASIILIDTRVRRAQTLYGRWLLLAMAIVLSTVAPAMAHPKPGAHADVRIDVGPEEVRVTVLMNILFADQIVNVPRATRDQVTDYEIDPLKLAMVEYLGGAKSGPVTSLVDRPNRVMIDNIEVTPMIRELRIIRPEPERRPGFVQNPALLLPQIQVVAAYPCKSPPRAVSLVWGSYPRDYAAQNRDAAPISDIEAVLTAGPSIDIIVFRKSEPEYVWHAPTVDSDIAIAPVQAPAAQKPRTALPPLLMASAGIIGATFLGVQSLRRRVGRTSTCWAGAACAILALGGWTASRVQFVGDDRASSLSDQDAIAVFTPLHANIYRAFDYTRETDIYDALAKSVDGALLDQIYNDVYRGLVMQEEGGALSRVKTVTPMSTEVLRPAVQNIAGDYVVRCRWRVEGVVYHWGHSHARTNEYVAEYGVSNMPAGWRIVSMRAIEQRRIETPGQTESVASVDAGVIGQTPVLSGTKEGAR